jgi:hypothetical protein
VFREFQEQWLEAHRQEYRPIRWRAMQWVTPFGRVAMPTRVIRRRDRQRGGYHSVLKMLTRGKATRLLSPLVERAALEAAGEQNYRPAAKQVSRGCRERISHWVVWRCVQHYGEKLRVQLARDWWPDRTRRRAAEVVVTEIDSTWLKRQRRGRLKRQARQFLMHVAIHYTGRIRRLQRPGRKDVQLREKRWLMGADPIVSFGRRARKQRDRHYPAKAPKVVLSDGDEGLKVLRRHEFSEATWLLDRWHLARRVREYVGNDQPAYQQIMQGAWASDSERMLEALRDSDRQLQEQKPEAFQELFGYVLGNREGIDDFKELPARLRRSHGRREAPVRAGSGAVEKNVEVQINRRFKKQGRSWNPVRADRLAQLCWLQHQPADWEHWWQCVCLSTVKVNPSWDPLPLPTDT